MNNIKNSFSKTNYILVIWILTLTLLSGMVNVYAITSFGTPITHYTGNASLIAINIYNNNNLAIRILSIMLSFLLGAIFSGSIFHEQDFSPKKRYGILLISSGFIILLLELVKLEIIEIYILSFIIGMQNTMFIKYKSVLVRSSHITGYLTDLGFLIGAFFRGKDKDTWRILFYFISICIFIFGGVLILYIINAQLPAKLFIGLAYIFVGLYYLLIRISGRN